MPGIYKAVKVTDKVWWVGVIDRSLKEFHGYRTPRGTTYNAYLVMADRITLIDTVKKPHFSEMMERISSVVDPSKIDYIISNHAEMDHSGCLIEAMEAIKPEKVFASTVGASVLRDELHGIGEITPVKDGETLSLGNMNATFIESRMLHWPDSMMTYLDSEKLLFSQDAFGMHLGTYKKFDDEIPWDMLEWEAKTYYANIILPYSDFVLKFFDKLGGLNLDIKTIAPDHGPIWRSRIPQILELYKKMAAQKFCERAIVVYDTMWHSTEVMAKAICEGLDSQGIETMLYPLESSHRTFIATELIEAGALIVGSSTLNRNMLPRVADILTYLKGLSPRNLIGASFGSYGWSGEAADQIAKMLGEMKVNLVTDPLKVKHVPKSEDLKKCYELGALLGEKLREGCKLPQQ